MNENAKGTNAAKSDGDAERDQASDVSLNELMELIGELMLGHARIHQVILAQRKRMGPEETAEELGRIADHLSHVVGDLQGCVLKAKMIPAKGLLRRLAGIAREASRESGGEMVVELEGTDTEADRDILNEIEVPLTEWVRSLAARDGRTGTLKLAFANEDNLAVVRTEVGGTGGKTCASALKSVAECAERLSGLIDVDRTRRGGGAMRLQLPLTNAMFFGQLAKLHDQLYMIPVSGIEEIIEAEHGELESDGDRQTYLLGDRRIPVLWPHRLLRIPRAASAQEKVQLVIAGIAERRIALAVDELYWSQEVRIKPLGDRAEAIEGIAGSTMLAGGKVVLILDLREILKLADGDTT